MRMFALSFVLAIACVTSSAVMADEAAKPTTVRVFDAGTLNVPASYKRTEPKSQIVEHEFIVSGEGDAVARVTMMAAGGDVAANIDRWKGQFSGGEAAAQKSEEVKAGDWTLHLVDLSGTFKDSMGGGPFSGAKTIDRPNYAMLGAILVHPEGRKYFVKMTGPSAVIQANRESFVEMIKGVK